MVLWHADREVNPLPHDVEDSEADGAFFFHELDPGTYVLEAAEEPSVHAKYGYESFYPGVKDRGQAKPLVVEPGSGNMRADFSVLRIPLFRIKGYLRGIPEGDNDEVVVIITSPGDPILRTEPVHLGRKLEQLL